MNTKIEDIINQQMEKIREMKNPVIMMNDLDLKEWVERLNIETTIATETKHNFYSGILIRPKEYIERGVIIIYDDYTTEKHLV